MKKNIFIISFFLNLIFLGLTIRHFINAPKVIKSTGITYFLNRNEVFSKLPKDTTDIIFAGDSHIQQFELAELFHSLNVKNRSIDYDTSLGLLNRINELTIGKPSKIFIEIGENDLSQNIAVKTILNNIESIVKVIKAQSPKSNIYLQAVIPNKYYLKNIMILNIGIKKLAVNYQINFIDLDSYFLYHGLKSKYDSGDGIHLNGNGYLEWSKILLPLIN